MSSAAILERAGRVAVIRLNRPERANVLDGEMVQALGEVINAAAGYVQAGVVRCVLLHGSGEHFCGGGDIRSFAEAGEQLETLIDARLAAFNATILRLATLPVPVVAALNGSVAGAGIGLAFSADFVLAAQSMKLRCGYAAIGFTPDAGTSWVLTRLVGPMRARYLVLTNRPWNAIQCQQAGLIAEIHPDETLLQAAHTVAESLACGSQTAQAGIKRLIDRAAIQSLEEQLVLEHQLLIQALGSPDAREGVAAFLERRPPKFQ